MSHLFNTYARMPLTLVRGEGAWLFDDQGRRYLDAVSGIAVCSLGHAHPRLADVLADQARTLWHTANIVHIPQQEALAEALTRVSGLDQAFMTNSGVEAIECALKLARRHAHARGIEQPQILVANNSFHGRSLAALSASGNIANQAGFGPLVEGFARMPFGDLETAEQALADNPNIVAVLLEPIQGEGGVKPAPPGYLTGIRRACDRHQALMMLDEIQTGLCRTGRWFAFQHEPDLHPDVITVAKALGNGMPIGACLARSEVADLLTPGLHGSTFGGNPLACRVGLEVIRIMEEQDIADHAETIGRHLRQRLQAGLADQPAVVDIRGRGLMIGIELTESVTDLKMAAMEKGLIINVTRGNIVRLLPPLIIDQDQADRIADILIDLIKRQFST